MLISYTIKGFKSFKEETTVDLLPTNYKTLTDKNIHNGILKGALFVGSNAGGKSNIIMPVSFLAMLLFAKYDINLDRYVCLFADNKQMELTYNFKINGSTVHYYISYTSNQPNPVLIEKLYIDKILMLERIGNNAKSDISNKEILYTNVADDVLILREIYFNTKFRNNEILLQWFEFLHNFIYIDLSKQSLISFKDDILHTEDYLRKYGDEKINHFLKQHNFGQRINYQYSDDEVFNLTFIRNGMDVEFPYMLESLGNKILLMLLNKFFYIVTNGGILVLDEFSSGFHNDLEELLVKYFMENAQNAQLLFVSHSTNLLSNRLLRPDQIYTVDFEPEKGSVINRISKEQPREAQNLEKMYLGGVFGGLPNYTNE